MANCLYTSEELVDFIKEIDSQLLTGVSKSSLDTSQSKGDFSISTRALEKQKEYYFTLLKQVDPVCYRNIKGASAIQFKGSSC